MRLILFTLLGTGLGQTLPTLPVRSFHGFGGSCGNLSRRDPAVCVESGAGAASTRASMITQANTACGLLLAEEAHLRNGFHIIAYSQGGLIARHILHRCVPINRYIRRMVFVGTPHLGVGASAARLLQAIEIAPPQGKDFPTPRPENSEREGEDLQGSKGKSDGPKIKGRLLPASEYTNRGGSPPAFLADVNNVAWSPLYAGLDFIVNIMSKTEGTVRPSYSTGMGARYNAQGQIQDGSTVSFIASRPNGVGQLFNNGQLWNCLSDAGHNRFTPREIRVVYSTLFRESPGATSYKESALKQLAQFVRSYPNPCNGRS